MNVLLEYVIVFVVVIVFNYFTYRTNILDKGKSSDKIKKKGKKQKIKSKDKVVQIPTELLYLEKVYGLDISKIDYGKFVCVYSLINAFIISTIYIILMYLLDSLVMRIIIGIILLILMIIICYGLLARYYMRKEGK